ncbi:MAG TPA: LUD domain-containing protein [Rhizomicrobium sp.]
MSARDDILSAIRDQRVRSAPRPAPYRPPAQSELTAAFIARASLANAEVRILQSEDDIPQAIAELLRSKNLPAVLHVPASAKALPWQSAPGLTIETAAPGADDAALATAPFGIAETGTLAYPAAAHAPASWHFRAGLEIAILRAGNIVPHMETAIARLKTSGDLPHTINFVTGPSRTGDIEQTLELGAHGPKALAIFVIDPSQDANSRE